MVQTPLLTIITPTYNRADLIEKSIQSVIEQNTTIPFAWEMIIIDDWSTDNTKEIVGKYIKKYPDNIFYFYQKNSWIPGAARNLGLNHMNKKSDYTIFLDSDDELKRDLIYRGLKKIEELKKRKLYDRTIWTYFLCEDEYQNVIWKKRILKWKKERFFDYDSFLQGEINIEMWIRLKSNIFLKNPMLRFSEKVIMETVMWAQMWKWMDENWLKLYLRDYVGRFYRLNHTSWDKRICKTISDKRFKNNAEGNKVILQFIEKDLKERWYTKQHSEYLFRIGINYILCGEKKIGLEYMKKSLQTHFRITIWGIYIASKISKKIILFLYKRFVI